MLLAGARGAGAGAGSYGTPQMTWSNIWPVASRSKQSRKCKRVAFKIQDEYSWNPGHAWNVVMAKHMEDALKPTGESPGPQVMPVSPLSLELSPTSRSAFKISPALHIPIRWI